LPFAFKFFPESALQPSALLTVTHFEFDALLLIEPQSGLTQGGIHFGSDLLLPDSLAIAHYLLLLRVHFQPALSVSPEHLTILRREA
jgi:hypothetical protein